MLADEATEEVAEGASDGNGQVEVGENTAAPFPGEIVGQEPGRYGAEARFPHTNGGAGYQQCPVAFGNTGTDSGQAPDRQSPAGETDPAQPVTHPSHKRGGHH